MSMNVVLALIFYSCIFIMYIMNWNETKPKKNIVLGTTIPYTHLSDEPVAQIVKNYKKESTIVLVVLTALLVPTLFMSFGANMFYSMTWLAFAMIGQAVPYIRANKALRRFKKANNLHGEVKKITDLKLSVEEIKTPSPLWSIIPLVISLAPAGYLLFGNRELTEAYAGTLWSYLSVSVTILLCMVLHIVIDKRKKDAVGNNTEINYQLSRIRGKNWSKMFIVLNFMLAAINCLMFVDITFDVMSSNLTFALVMAFTLICIAFTMYVEFDTRKKQYKYTMENVGEGNVVIDEDDYWIWGMFYYNPKDNRIMIPSRVGSNTSINLAKPVGMIVMGLSAVLIAALPFIGGYILVAEKTPMTVEFTDTAIIATHMKEDYNIPMSDVISITETKEAPEIKSKINGWATDKIFKGTFSVKGRGTLEIFIPADAETYYIVETEDETYIFGK